VNNENRWAYRLLSALGSMFFLKCIIIIIIIIAAKGQKINFGTFPK